LQLGGLPERFDPRNNLFWQIFNKGEITNERNLPGDGSLAGFLGKISAFYEYTDKLGKIILGGKIWIK